MKLVYAGPFFYPSSEANSLRVRGMVDALMAAGHEVHVVCLGESEFDGNIDGVRVTRIPEYVKGTLSHFGSGIRGLFLGDQTVQWLRWSHCRPDALILYGTSLGYLLRLARFCRRYGVKFFLDVVEWYKPSHLPGGIIGPLAIANALSMRVFARRADGIIAISRYLESHFSRLGLPVLRVPPLFKQATRHIPLFRAKDGMCHICYVGTPGRKELLAEMFDGLLDAVNSGAPIEMHMVGMTRDEAELQGLPTEGLGEVVRFYGRVPNEEAISIVSACDFMLLLRPDQRFSRAGFPSKVVESLSCGTPVMANLTSDLSEYLSDGENAIIVPGTSPHLVSKCIQRAGRLSDESLHSMRNFALATSLAFSPKAHAARLANFFSGGK